MGKDGELLGPFEDLFVDLSCFRTELLAGGSRKVAVVPSPQPLEVCYVSLVGDENFDQVNFVCREHVVDGHVGEAAALLPWLFGLGVVILVLSVEVDSEHYITELVVVDLRARFAIRTCNKQGHGPSFSRKPPFEALSSVLTWRVLHGLFCN